MISRTTKPRTTTPQITKPRSTKPRTTKSTAQQSSGISGKLIFGLVAAVLTVVAGILAADLLMSRVNAKAQEYDKQGKLIKRTRPVGRAVKYQYGKAGLLSGISYHQIGAFSGLAYPAGNSVSFDYDPAGYRVGMKDSQGKTRYGYDVYGRPQEVVDPVGRKLSYEYDAWNQLRLMTFPDGYSVKSSYDVLGNLKSIGDGQANITYEYRGADNQVYRRLPNGILTVYESSPAGRLTSIRHTKPDSSLICSLRYEYDLAGRVTLIEETTPRGSSTTRYEYDLNGRMIKAQQPDGSTVTFEYDAMGNRTTQSDKDGMLQYQYDGFGRLIKAGETTFAYDANGNLNSKKDKTRAVVYEYDDEDRLIQVKSSKGIVRYFYDGIGNRIRREMDGRVTNYVNDTRTAVTQVVAEAGKDGKLSDYVIGLTRVGRRTSSGDAIYFLEDHLGSTRCVVDARGEMLARYSYSPFGAPTLTEGTAQTDFLFAGEQWDPDAKLIYLRSRYYDPELGRFLSPDPLPGSPTEPESFNEYAYANNDPANLVDPLGMQGWPPPPFYNPSRDLWKYQPPNLTGIAHPRPQPPQPHSWWYYLPGELGGMTARGELFHATSERDYYFRALLKLHPFSAGVLFANDALYDASHNRQGTAILNLSRKGLQEELSARASVFAPFTSRLATGVGVFNELSKTRFFQDSYSNLSAWFGRNGAGSMDSPGTGAVARTESLDHNRTIFFPPPGGGGGGAFPSVGGVYLDQTARIIGELGTITGAVYDPKTGQLILVGDKSIGLPPIKPEYLGAAIRAVYSQSPEAPGMTIDPRPENPRGPTMNVRFFGNTENTRLGWAMFEADRVMKGYSVGRDNVTKQKVQSNIPGYQSVTAMGLADGRVNKGIWSRFWLTPEPVTARVTKDAQAIMFDPIKVRVETQTMVWNGGKLVPAGDDIKDVHAEAFRAHFTERYDEFAAENGIYAELRQITQAVALAKWMRERGIPANGNLVRSLCGDAYPTPLITPSASDQQARRDGLQTSIVSVFGGVHMDPRIDPRTQAEADQFQKTLMKEWGAAQTNPNAPFTFDFQNKHFVAVALPAFGHSEADSYNAVETDLEGEKAADALAGLPGLARYYNSTHNEPTEFGFSWSLLLPRLEFEAASEKGKLEYLSVEGVPGTKVLVQNFVLTNQFGLGHQRFTEHSVDQDLRRIAFGPEQASSLFQALYPEPDGSYRIVLASGGQAIFDSQGRLRSVLSATNKAFYDYDARGRLTLLRSSREGSETKVRYEYDEKDRLVKRILGGSVAAYEYDPDGNLKTVRRGAHETLYKYGDKRLLTEIAIGGRTVAQKIYDADGRVLKPGEYAASKLGQQVEVTKDGKTVTVRDGAQAIKRRYDKQDRLIAMEDRAGNNYNYRYDQGGRISAVDVTLPTGGRASVEASSDGRSMTATDPRGVRTEYRVSEGGEIAEIRVNGQQAAAFKYDPQSKRLVEASYAGGDSERIKYADNGEISEYQRVTSDKESDADETLRLGYDNHGQLNALSGSAFGEIRLSKQSDLLSITRGGLTSTCRYNAAGKPVIVEGPDGSSLSYTYGADGKLLGIEASKDGHRATVDLRNENSIVLSNLIGGISRYTYTTAGSLASVHSAHGASTVYLYDDQGRLREVRLPNGASIEYRKSTSRSQEQTVTMLFHPASTREKQQPANTETPRIRSEPVHR